MPQAIVGRSADFRKFASLYPLLPSPLAEFISFGSTISDIVAGSGLEGVHLARAAHNPGKRVLILDPKSKPGDQLIQGRMMVLDEPRDAKKKKPLRELTSEDFERIHRPSGEVRFGKR